MKTQNNEVAVDFRSKISLQTGSAGSKRSIVSSTHVRESGDGGVGWRPPCIKIGSRASRLQAMY